MSRLLKNHKNQITQPYKKGVHNGIDLVGYKSQTCWLKAHSDGVVVDARNNYNKTDKTGNSYGNYVKIKHNDGYYTLYAHIKYSTVEVKVNQKVKQGDLIGYMGNTGHSNGAHLHWEVRNEKDEKIDPTPYLEKDLPSEWTKGTYELLKSKYIRTSPKVANNYVLVKECMSSVKSKLTSTKPNNKARFKIGVNVKLTKFEYDSKGNLWGKMINSWICVKDKTGNQVKKI